MIALEGAVGELTFDVQITRADTGKVENYTLVGYIDEAKLKELLAKNEKASGITFKMKDDPRITRVGVGCDVLASRGDDPVLVRMLLKDIYDHVHPDDREYFRTSREQRFGTTMEHFFCLLL